MKKLYLLLFIFFLFLCIGCQSEKQSASMKDYQKIAESHDYQFFDVSDEFHNNKRINKAGMIATTVWHTEFYILNNNEQAEEMFITNYDFFTEQKKSSTSYSDIEDYGSNYQTYSLTTNHAYMYISRIDNTLLYIQVPVEYHRKVKSIAKELGY